MCRDNREAFLVAVAGQFGARHSQLAQLTSASVKRAGSVFDNLFRGSRWTIGPAFWRKENIKCRPVIRLTKALIVTNNYAAFTSIVFLYEFKDVKKWPIFLHSIAAFTVVDAARVIHTCLNLFHRLMALRNAN